MCSIIGGTNINIASEDKKESSEATYDFWDEANRLFVTSSVNNHINYDL